MPARRVPALALPVDAKAEVSFRGYEHRTPLLTIATGGPALLVTLTLPERLEAGHVEFARELAAKRGPTRWPSSASTAACPRCPGHRSRMCWPPSPTPGPAIPASPALPARRRQEVTA